MINKKRREKRKENEGRKVRKRGELSSLILHVLKITA
jgi:hypothetical protein